MRRVLADPDKYFANSGPGFRFTQQEGKMRPRDLSVGGAIVVLTCLLATVYTAVAQTWTPLGPTLLPNGQVADAAVNSPARGRVMLAESPVWNVANLFRSPAVRAINGSGVTGLPDVPVNDFVLD